MPTYTVRDPQSGRSLKLTGDAPPTEAELESLFAHAGSASPTDRAPEKSWTDTAVDLLPAAGGMAGSFVGAGKWNPLGMAGAAIGGAGGEFVRQIVQAARGKTEDVPNSVEGQYRAALAQGAEQAGLEGGGRLAIGGAVRALKGVRQLAEPVRSALSTPAMKDLAVDAALDLVPGGRMMRGATKAAVRAIRRTGTGAAADEAAAPIVAAATREAAPLASGYERYMPNLASAPETAAPAIAKPAMNGPHVRALSEGEQRGIDQLDSYFNWKYGDANAPSVGNGLYKEEPRPLMQALREQAAIAPDARITDPSRLLSEGSPAADLATVAKAAPTKARGVFRGRMASPLPPPARELPQWASGAPTGGPDSPMWGPGSELGGGAREQRLLSDLLRSLARSGKVADVR